MLSLSIDYTCVADVSTRAFYEPIPTIDFIESHFRANPSRANQGICVRFYVVYCSYLGYILLMHAC